MTEIDTEKVYNTLHWYMFEHNDEKTRDSIKNHLGTFLYKDFKVICDRSNNSQDDINNSILNVDIISNTNTYTYTLSKTGLNYNEHS